MDARTHGTNLMRFCTIPHADMSVFVSLSLRLPPSLSLTPSLCSCVCICMHGRLRRYVGVCATSVVFKHSLTGTTTTKQPRCQRVCSNGSRRTAPSVSTASSMRVTQTWRERVWGWRDDARSLSSLGVVMASGWLRKPRGHSMEAEEKDAGAQAGRRHGCVWRSGGIARWKPGRRCVKTE